MRRPRRERGSERQIDRRVEALDHRHRDGLERAADAEPPRLSPEPRRDGPNELPEHDARQHRVERQLDAKTMRDGQYPLSHGHVRDHSIHETGREVTHPSSDTACAEAPSFTRKSDRTAPPAVRTLRQNQTVRQDPAAEVRLHLCDHEGGEWGFGGGLELGEERLPVGLDCLVEHGRLRLMPLVSSSRRS